MSSQESNATADHTERIHAHGHENVQAAHASTLEITTDDYLTPAGDCIIGIEADRAPSDFASAFVAACQRADARIELKLTVGDRTTTVVGRGDPALTFETDRSLVVRTSDYVDDRTVMLEADASAAELPRPLVAALADGASLTATLRVDSPTG